MDFGALPPEINSGRMYLGPGPATMLAASAGWESLAAELSVAASGYESVITTLTQEWQGPTSMSMAAAVTPYVAWIRAIAEQCEQSALQATAAAAAYETAYAMAVPSPLIAANRAQLMALIATNFLGQNTPAIMATEAEYSEMWAQDATAMYSYAASSASASSFSTFTAPPQTTNPGGLAGQAGAVAQAGRGWQCPDRVGTLDVLGAASPAGAVDARIIVQRGPAADGGGYRGVTGNVGGFRPDQCTIESDRRVEQKRHQDRQRGHGGRIRLDPGFWIFTNRRRRRGLHCVRRGLRCSGTGCRWRGPGCRRRWNRYGPVRPDVGFRGSGLDSGGRGSFGFPNPRKLGWSGWSGSPGAGGRSGRRRVGERGPGGLTRDLVGAAELGGHGVFGHAVARSRRQRHAGWLGCDTVGRNWIRDFEAATRRDGRTLVGGCGSADRVPPLADPAFPGSRVIRRGYESQKRCPHTQSVRAPLE